MATTPTLESLRDLGRNHFLARCRRSLPPDGFNALQPRIDKRIVTRIGGNGPIGRAEVGPFAFPIMASTLSTTGNPFLQASVGGSESTIAARAGDALTFGFDLWLSIGMLLADSRLGRQVLHMDDLLTPVVDHLENLVLQELAPEYGPLGSPWPGGSSFAIALSHDVDRIHKTFQRFTHSIGEARQGSLRHALDIATSRNPDAYWRFDDIIRLERGLDTKSTFFFLHEAPGDERISLRNRLLLTGACRLDNPRVQNAIREIENSGWGIGLHSSSFARGDRERLREEKAILERIAKRPIRGVRQHLLSPEVQSLWDPQIASGFSFDSTMGYSDRLGFRAGTCFPYCVEPASAFLEIPFQIMDGAIDPSHRATEDRCLRVLREVEAVGGLLVLLWHQRFFNDSEFPGFTGLYERLIREARNRGAWVGSLEEVERHWSGTAA